MIKRLFFILTILGTAAFSGAAQADAQGAVTVAATDIVQIGDVACARVKNTWQPGTLISAKRFLTLRRVRSNILIKLQKATTSRRRNSLKKKLAQVRTQLAEQITICTRFSIAAPTPTPTVAVVAPAVPIVKFPTPVPTTDPLVTKTPTRTPATTRTPQSTATPQVTVTATPTPASTPTSSPTAVAPGKIPESDFAILLGAEIYAADNVFLGIISKSTTEAQSIANPFGTYGSPYATTSIFNNYGRYGSQYSTKSPFSAVTYAPPVIVRNGVTLAYLSVNNFRTPYVDTNELADWIGRGEDTP